MQDREFLIRVSYMQVCSDTWSWYKYVGFFRLPSGVTPPFLLVHMHIHTLPPCTQLYNEDINDLLAPENSKLPVHESREGYPFVAGLREDIVTGAEQVLALLDAGERHRHIGETKMNKNSSRSHTIFRMVRGS